MLGEETDVAPTFAQRRKDNLHSLTNEHYAAGRVGIAAISARRSR